MKTKDLGRLGRGNDSLVAHINPFEAVLLAAHGGSGTVNPRTGLLEFDDDSGEGDGGPSDGGNTSNAGENTGGMSGAPGSGVAGPEGPGTGRGDGPGPDGLGADYTDAPYGDYNKHERTALANNLYDPSHPAVARGRALDQGTMTAKSFIDRLAEQFNPMRAYGALFGQVPADPVEVTNQVVSQISGPVGVAMSVGRALSEYALDQGWSIGYGYESVMSGADNSERAQDLRRQINEAAGLPTTTPTPTTTPVPEVQVVTQVPGYRSLLGGGYDGFKFLDTSGAVNRATRRFA